MKTRTRSQLAAAALLTLGALPLSAQVLHVNDRWKECAIVLDASLTQDAWRQFVGEAGLVSYVRPLASARPLGARRFEVAILRSATRLDDADPAWNDTFSHPDSTHWLFDGDALPIPGLMVRAGVADRVDVGVYFTQNVASNYGIVGGQVQYGLLDGANGSLAAAGRLTVARLFGPEDMSLGVYGLDFLVSRSIAGVEPYVGVSGYLSRGREHTTKVSLRDESVLGVQGMLGVAVSLRGLRIGAEYNVARVHGYSVRVGYGF